MKKFLEEYGFAILATIIVIIIILMLSPIGITIRDGLEGLIFRFGDWTAEQFDTIDLGLGGNGSNSGDPETPQEPEEPYVKKYEGVYCSTLDEKEDRIECYEEKIYHGNVAEYTDVQAVCGSLTSTAYEYIDTWATDGDWSTSGNLYCANQGTFKNGHKAFFNSYYDQELANYTFAEWTSEAVQDPLHPYKDLLKLDGKNVQFNYSYPDYIMELALDDYGNDKSLQMNTAHILAAEETGHAGTIKTTWHIYERYDEYAGPIATIDFYSYSGTGPYALEDDYPMTEGYDMPVGYNAGYEIALFMSEQAMFNYVDSGYDGSTVSGTSFNPFGGGDVYVIYTDRDGYWH